MSIAGRWINQYKVKNGKIVSFGNVQKKPKSNTPSNGTMNITSDCIDWYLVTTYYYADGSTSQEAQYLTTTCSDCSNPNEASLCPDQGGGGNSGGGSTCFSDEVDNFDNESSNGQVVSTDMGYTSSPIDDFTKYKNPKWNVYDGAGGWHLLSQEMGTVKWNAGSNQWNWKSLQHGGISFTGSTMPGVAVTYTQGIGTPSFTPETAQSSTILYAGIEVDFTVTFKFMCDCPNIPILNSVSPVSKDVHNHSTLWDANP